MLRKQMAAGKFKAECLKVMDDVQKKKICIVITKRNVPVAELMPIDEEKRSSFGWMKGTGEVVGDIIESIGEDWDADR